MQWIFSIERRNRAMFQALHEAHRQHDVFRFHIETLPFFDVHRADPRFRGLLERMNLA
jgi:hypothetical protein